MTPKLRALLNIPHNHSVERTYASTPQDTAREHIEEYVQRDENGDAVARHRTYAFTHIKGKPLTTYHYETLDLDGKIVAGPMQYTPFP